MPNKKIDYWKKLSDLEKRKAEMLIKKFDAEKEIIKIEGEIRKLEIEKNYLTNLKK